MIDDVVVRQAGKKGKGVFALRNFRADEFIFQFKRGKVVHRENLPTLTREEGRHLNEVDYDTWEIMRSPEKYINHSCSPNSIVKGRRVFALGKIREGDEITGDYRINAFDGRRWKCYCGSRNCAGWVVSDFFTIPERLQKKYLPYTIPAIMREYRKRKTTEHVGLRL